MKIVQMERTTHDDEKRVLIYSQTRTRLAHVSLLLLGFTHAVFQLRDL
jgi:hypothetical protein